MCFHASTRHKVNNYITKPGNQDMKKMDMDFYKESINLVISLVFPVAEYYIYILFEVRSIVHVVRNTLDCQMIVHRRFNTGLLCQPTIYFPTENFL